MLYINNNFLKGYGKRLIFHKYNESMFKFQLKNTCLHLLFNDVLNMSTFI